MHIPRAGVEALMPEEYQREIVQSVAEQSSVMSLAYRAPNMTRAQRRIPCLSVLPAAYFSISKLISEDDLLHILSVAVITIRTVPGPVALK